MSTCKNCGDTFSFTEDELSFLERVSPVIGRQIYPIPEPTLCAQCRLQRRLAHRNEKKLYHRKCDLSGKQIISIYASDKELVVYDQHEWWSDKWDPLSYGREFDFTRPFFAQLAELKKEVPRMSVQQEHNENSEYTNNVSYLKNCYLLFSSDYDQDCCYGIWVQRSKDSIDNFMLDECERSYENVFSNKIYNSSFVYFSSNCSDSAFLFDCRGCKNCLMCWGLRNKQYCISNKQYSKEEYEQKRNEFHLGSYKNLQAAKEQFAKIIQGVPHPHMRKHGSVLNCTGDFLTDAEDCIDCYEIVEGKDCMRVIGFKIKDAMDCTYVHGELAYENCECFPTPSHSAFNLNSYTGSDLYYCDMCMNNCQNLFGCIGLRHKQHCILNKQYTKEEYEELVPKIIAHMRETGEWGEFYPVALSTFGYNESEASQYFPLSQDQVQKREWTWHEDQEEQTSYMGPPVEIPDSIQDVDESICAKILTCEVSGKPYKIIPQELNFYQSMNLPIPRHSPDQRHVDRLAFRSKRKLYRRKCSKCSTVMETSYEPDRPEQVYCEKCYLDSLE